LERISLKRKALDYLLDWLGQESRKPLVMRGARQVGKTYLVRDLARHGQKVLVELNFEKQPKLVSLFNSNNPKQILTNIESSFDIAIDVNNTLLFLDEIQAAPQILAQLRWFAEEMPELTVIATGSLLDFVLAEHTFSMPVGRITYLHLEPLSFEEFLLSLGKDKLYKFVTTHTLVQEIPELIHEQLLALFKQYLIVGGLPAAVASWARAQSPTDINRIHMDLLTTYRDDFAKYAQKLTPLQLEEVLTAVPRMLGEKFIYSHVDPTLSSQKSKEALQKLIKARICHPVYHTSANGVPLAAQMKQKIFKMIFLDVGLTSALLGLKLNLIQNTEEIILVNAGGIAEQVVGQLLRTIEPFYIEPHLFYWVREEKSSSAEIDYILQHHDACIPIEVKSGSQGKLKSLHLFMKQKKTKIAVRIYSGLPNKTEIDDYTLIDLPFYLTEQIHRYLESLN
jgi:predicted AAA+ superfamily ATPase